MLQRHQQGVDVMALLQSCFQTQQKPRTTVYLSGERLYTPSNMHKRQLLHQRQQCLYQAACARCRGHITDMRCKLLLSHTSRAPFVVLSSSACWLMLPAGPVTFCCRGPADAGWGCGYRNIQMQASHLLLTSPEHSRVLFGGAGFIPDIREWLLGNMLVRGRATVTVAEDVMHVQQGICSTPSLARCMLGFASLLHSLLWKSMQDVGLCVPHTLCHVWVVTAFKYCCLCAPLVSCVVFVLLLLQRPCKPGWKWPGRQGLTQGVLPCLGQQCSAAASGSAPQRQLRC